MIKRYSWKQMPKEYHESYYNDEDFNEGRKFTIIDNETGKEYIYPKTKTKIGVNGKLYDQIIIEDDLWNEEFIAWAICTSKDFIKHIGTNCFTPGVLEYVVNNFEFPETLSEFAGIYSCFLTQSLWTKAYERNKNIVTYIPNKYITPEMLQTLSNTKNAYINGINLEYLTPEIFSKIYFNSDKDHKLKLITPVSYYDYTSFITREVADDILSIDIRTIINIPKKFISEENAKKAMDSNIKLIEYVPTQYQTIEYQKKAIDKDVRNLCLIDSTALQDEIFYYALNKSGVAIKYVPKERKTREMCEYAINLDARALAYISDKIKTPEMCFSAISKDSMMIKYVPKERRTREMCEYAINLDARALEYTPDKVKTPEMCFSAVVKDPTKIIYVPVKILNNEFAEALKTAGVTIPVRYLGYVKDCLRAHLKLEDVVIKHKEPEKIESKETELKVEENDYMTIRLDQIQGLLRENILKILNDNNILTVGDLLKVADDKEFNSFLLDKSSSYYKEVVGAIKLLKCKYLGMDPFIDMDQEKSLEETCDDFGLSVRVKNSLARNGYDTKTFYEVLNDDLKKQKLLQCKNMGQKGVQEILLKTSIVFDYYDRQKQKEETFSEEETIESLNKELVQIRAEIQRLNARTDEILAKIQEKMLANKKGGVSK